MKNKIWGKRAVSSAEQIARYAYLVDAVPASVARQAHDDAFAGLSAAQRQQIEDVLGGAPPRTDPAPQEEREALAGRADAAQLRDAVLTTDGAATVAAGFVSSTHIAAYFAAGAGSVAIDQRPPWVQEIAWHDSAPVDAGRINHFKGVNTGEWYG